MRTFLALLLFTLIWPAARAAAEGGSLYDVLRANPEFSTLVAAIDFTGLDEAMDDPDARLTAFAPTNRAFERTLAELGLTPADLLTERNRELTTQVLLYHVLDGVALRKDVLELDEALVETLQGEEIRVDILFRWFILLNRNTFVVQADLRASNGVAHVVNRVLLPPDLFAATVFELLENDSRFSTLVAALRFTGLDEVLDDPSGTFTLLAPTNRAFDRTLARLGLTPGDLLTEDNRELTRQILLYHVLEFEVDSAGVRAADGQTVPTALGDEIQVDVLFRRFIVLNRSALVVRTDRDASNGIVHDLTAVLLPPSLGLH